MYFLLKNYSHDHEINKNNMHPVESIIDRQLSYHLKKNTCLSVIWTFFLSSHLELLSVTMNWLWYWILSVSVTSCGDWYWILSVSVTSCDVANKNNNISFWRSHLKVSKLILLFLSVKSQCFCDVLLDWPWYWW
jgi:hypothetical protein